MSDDSRQIIADYFVLTGVATIARKEQLRLRYAVYEGTLDADSSTRVLLRSLGLNKPQVVHASVMVRDSGTTGNWEIYDNRDANTADKAFALAFDDGTAANPYSILIGSVGADMQGQKFRLLIAYTELL